MSRPTKECGNIAEEIVKLTKPPETSSSVTGSRDLPVTIISIGTLAETEESARDKARQLVDAMAVHTIMGPSTYFAPTNFDDIWELEQQRLRTFMTRLDSDESKSLKVGKKKEKRGIVHITYSIYDTYAHCM